MTKKQEIRKMIKDAEKQGKSLCVNNRKVMNVGCNNNVTWIALRIDDMNSDRVSVTEDIVIEIK